ncbi:MAG: N-acetyltransferase [Chloroflexi bacterium]|nr:N-acetyltransferase [Chloroflexota bacterium]
MSSATPAARSLVIRLADPTQDAEAVAAIYAPAVADSVASFETVAPDADEMAARMRRILTWTPWLVAEASEGEAVGYAYASRHVERAGYRWAVNLSVYVAPARQGQGVGRRLYDTLLPILRAQGLLHAYAGITPPNPGSIALHEAIGMRRFATYAQVGHKLGSWWDVAWFHLQLVDRLPDPPPEPVALPALLADPEACARIPALRVPPRGS